MKVLFPKNNNLIIFIFLHLMLLNQTLSAQNVFTTLFRQLTLANATLTGHVYADTNGNGTQDASEPDLPNVNMVIIQSNGGVQAVITNTDGDWIAIVPEGLTNIFLDNNDLPSGYLLTEGNDPTTVLALPNQINYAGTDGIHFRGILSGHLYFDDNGNGTQDVIEADMPQIDIRLTDSFGNIYNTTSNADGDWSYSVAVTSVEVLILTNDADFPIGATQTEGTNPTTHTVILSTDTFTENEGFFKGAMVYGHLYHDANGNGNQDTGEPDMPLVEVIVTNAFGNQLSLVTDNLGNWSVLCPIGNTTIHINTVDPDFPIGATQTQGTNPMNVNVVNGTNITTVPCGFYSQGTLTGHLYYDVNNNGIQNTSEPNMPFIKVTVTDNYGGIHLLETDAEGNWSVTISTGNATSMIDVNDPEFLLGALQTQGTNPTITNVLAFQTTLSDLDGFYSTYDYDGDGISDIVEIDQNTDNKDPCDPTQLPGYTGFNAGNALWQASDCDGDGVLNGDEAQQNSDPYDPCDPMQSPNYTGYNQNSPIWQTADCDDDGLTNAQELTHQTLPYVADTDGDGVLDGTEVAQGTDPLDPCDPTQNALYTGFDSQNTTWQASDCDGDGVLNGVEAQQNSDPYDPCDPMQNPGYTGYDSNSSIWLPEDCDGDGISNGLEVQQNTDPYDPNGNGLLVYNTITPNGDGLNDYIHIENIEYYPENQLKIFNRWGVLVFEASGYDNAEIAFKGYSEGRITVKSKEKLPSGTYYYLLEITLPNGDQIKQNGFLYLN